MTHKQVPIYTFTLSILMPVLILSGCQSTKVSNGNGMYEAEQYTIEVKSETTSKLGYDSTLDSVVKEFRLRKQATIQEFDSGYVRAVEAMEKAKYEYAMGLILHARVTLNEGREFLTTSEIEARDIKASELIESIKKAQELHGKLYPYQ